MKKISMEIETSYGIFCTPRCEYLLKKKSCNLLVNRHHGFPHLKLESVAAVVKLEWVVIERSKFGSRKRLQKRMEHIWLS